MADLLQLAKTQTLKLAPFLKTLIVYFAWVRQEPRGELWTTVLKCLPIIALMLYILLKGIRWNKDYRRSQYILMGLLFSCFGDALLNINQFLFGMVSFGIAHCFYIAAFGWQPRMWHIGMGLYAPVIMFCYFLHKNLDAMLFVGVPIYSLLISTMLWRAIASATTKKDVLSIICALGASLFVISDALIAMVMFLEMDIQHARLYIMATYYAAQFAIALSTANDGPTLKRKEKQANKLK